MRKQQQAPGRLELVRAFVNTIDLVNIWILALLIIGYRYAARKSLSGVTRAVSVVAVFLVYVALRLALASIRGV